MALFHKKIKLLTAYIKVKMLLLHVEYILYHLNELLISRTQCKLQDVINV